MRKRSIGASLLAVIFLTMLAQAQSADWQAVRDIPPGTKIKITLKHGRTFGHYEFEEATDDELRCFLPDLGSRSYRRENVAAVYLVHSGARIGFAIGAGSGAVLGAVNNNPALGRTGNAVVGAVTVGVIGMAIGAGLNPFFRGKAIYRSPNANTAKVERLPTPAPHSPKKIPGPKTLVALER
jgi:hypothetical protein